LWCIGARSASELASGVRRARIEIARRWTKVGRAIGHTARIGFGREHLLAVSCALDVDDAERLDARVANGLRETGEIVNVAERAPANI
jgi:hypothetical protein